MADSAPMELPTRRLPASLAGLVAAALLAGCRTSAGPPSPCDVAGEARAVAVGEYHDDPAHHAAQAELLRCMAQGDGPLLLGMEMFQRPFQQPLDDYVAGRIDEREMLRRTEYFSRWNYDWTIYAPLWRTAREVGARIVALNADAAITRKIGRQGLAALAPEERARIAADIDLTVATHRERILAQFRGGAHPMPDAMLEPLYEAMTVWDETMAESAAVALAEAGPGARILIVAGSQHVQQFDGIPARLARRTGPPRPYVVVLRTEGGDDSDDVADAELADSVMRLAPVPKRTPPKLGVGLGAPAAEGLRVTEVTEGGTAHAAGIRAGDVLTHVGGEFVSDLTDLRWVLDPKSLGDRVELRWLRDGGAVVATAELVAPPAPAPPVVTNVPPPAPAAKP